MLMEFPYNDYNDYEMQYLYKDDDNVFKEITKRFCLWWCMRVLKVESTAEKYISYL